MDCVDELMKWIVLMDCVDGWISLMDCVGEMDCVDEHGLW